MRERWLRCIVETDVPFEPTPSPLEARSVESGFFSRDLVTIFSSCAPLPPVRTRIWATLSARPPGAGQRFNRGILDGQVRLDLLRFVQDGFGVVVGICCSVARSGADHLLADHDDAQKDQLEECLRYPWHIESAPPLMAWGNATRASAANK